MVIPRTRIRKEVTFYSWMQTTRRMGQSRRADDDKIWRKRIPSFPCHDSIAPRNAQEQRWRKIINTLLRCSGNDWNCFSHNVFLLISSIPTEKSQTCVKNAKSVMLEHRDLFWQDNLTHFLCRQVWWKHLHLWPMILRKKSIAKIPRTSGKAITTKSSD